MAKHNDKGKLLEDIVASFHEKENIKVEKNIRLKPKNGNGRKREIDILLTSYIAGYKINIPIECKNHKNSVGVKEIESFTTKLKYLALPVEQAIFISTNGFTRGAKDVAKEFGIRLLNMHGLKEDGLSLAILTAIQSIVYVMPILNEYRIRTTAPDGDTVNFYNAEKKYVGSIMDLTLDMWKKHDTALTLGTHKFKVNIPNGWYNLYNDELYECMHISIELIFIAYVMLVHGTANESALINDETGDNEKYNITADFDTSNSLYCFHNENQLKEFWNARNEFVKISYGRIKLPKVRFNKVFYPFSEDVQNAFYKFHSNKNLTDEEMKKYHENFNMEDDFFESVWKK